MDPRISITSDLTVYKYWLVLRSTLKNNARSCAMLQLCHKITKQNQFLPFLLSDVIHDSATFGICSDLPNIVVRPKNRRKCMVRRCLHHVPRKHGSHDVLFPGNIMLHWWNWVTLFIFAHYVSELDQSWSCNSGRDITMCANFVLACTIAEEWGFEGCALQVPRHSMCESVHCWSFTGSDDPHWLVHWGLWLF